MNRASVAILLVAITHATPSAAQRLGTNLEVFGTGSFIAGMTPVTTASGSHAALHAGARGDVGAQFRQLGVGVGGRYWQMAPTNTYGGQGLDFFFIAEWRPGNSARTTFRSAYGYGVDDFDSGRGPERPTVSTNGDMWSVGIGHQVITPGDIRLALNADLVVPHSRSGPIGRRRPVLEFGVGYRFSEFHAIGPLP